jgi:YHS domain-containing protein
VLYRSILLLLLVLFLARAIWRLVSGIVEGASGSSSRRAQTRATPDAVKLVQDPVCGTFVVPGRSPSLVRQGATVYFCSDRCRDRYANQ